MVAVFCFGKTCQAELHLIVNEIQIAGKDDVDNDFIELYNPTDKKINLKDYKLVKRAKNGTSDSPIKSWVSDTYIQSNDYYLWANNHNNFAESIKANASTSYTISKDNGIAIKNKATDEIIDSVGWGVCQNAFIENLPALNASEGKSIERKNFQDTDNNAVDFDILETPTPTPSQKEDVLEEEDDVLDNASAEEISDKQSFYFGKIKINEIKADTSDEFIEIISNIENSSVDFENWCVKDEVKYNKTSWDCKKPSKVEGNGIFYILYGKFSLNSDSKGDTVYLYDENKKLAGEVKYEKAKKDCYYAIDGSVWRWTSRETVGKENEFDPEISAKIQKDKTIYSGVYADFSAKINETVKKLAWDFGDKHKSYLKNTRHKYEKPKKYAASLKISGSCEEKIYPFSVKVEKYEAPKIRIVSFSPNPKGNDSENEWMEIQNKSKKKINLKGWSIATGWENLYNHPIRKDFPLKPGKTKKLTRDLCAFTLANTKTKIELRSPDGKVVQKIEYDREKNKIEEDELYEKSDSGWEWAGIVEDATDIRNAEAVENVGNIESEEIQANLGKYSKNPDWQKKQNHRIRLANSVSKIKIFPKISPDQGRVLGAKDVKIAENYYIFTQPPLEKHWLVKFSEKIWAKLNLTINLLFLNFLSP